MSDGSALDGHSLSPVKRAIVELREMRARLEECERRRSEPIALMGVGCRFPGGANDPGSFWQLLRDGIDAVGEVPAERWDRDALYDADPDAPGRITTRHAGFLRDVDRFDDEFFGISPREAAGIDPQQRLLLEVSWRALEDAGQPADELMDSDTGVFTAIGGFDYAQLQARLGSRERLDAYYATGVAHSVAAGRLSYVLGLRGPSIAVDTGCSASLVAVHLACQALRAGDCRLALAGGVNLILGPEGHIALSRARMMAPDGRCKAFDASADGFGRAEGCGMVVLKRLADALADGDRIRAIIRGSAVNHDGRGNGLTVPNGPSQSAVIRAALRTAGLDAARIQYVETHGTGTALGDPIEALALAAVVGEAAPAHKVRIGSVKTNIGHAESAAGIAGLIKVVLALEHGEVPPHLHFRRPSPHIDWDRLPLQVATKRTPWPIGPDPRVAGVSSFSFSGTNAHVIVEEAPARPAVTAEFERPLHMITVSARSPESLRALAGRYADALAGNALALADFAFTANAGRGHFAHRATVTASDTAAALARLRALAAGTSEPGVRTGQVSPAGPPGVVFLFTGQGSQYTGMGSELYRTQPTFRRAIDRCGELLQAHLDRPLIALLFGGDGAASALEATVSAQPALFALEWALAELWASWGVEPAAMLGHSVGEYVAACRAGVFSLEEGLRLIAAQGRLIQALPVGGAMAAIRADEARVRRAMAAERGELDLAALNAPDQVVISGRSGAVEAVLARLAAQGIGGARLAVPHALHSALIEPMLAEFARVAASVRYAEPTVPLVSSLTGQPFGAGDLPGAGYWARQAREPVRFARGIETLFSQGHRLFLELGPAPTLCSLGAQCVPHGAAAWLPSLRPGRPDWESLLASLGTLYRRGTRVSWKGFDRDYPRRIQSLPGYAFERKRFWFQNAAGPSVSATPAARWSIAVAAAGRQADQVPIDLALHTYAAKYQALGRLAAAYIVRALRSLGAFAAAGATLGPEDLVETAGIRPIYGSLMSTWLKKLVDSGLLREHGGRFVADRPLPEAHPEAIIEAERSLFEDAPALLRYVEGCGRLLPDVITGRESALETLFPGGSFDLAEEVYERAALSRYFNGIVRSVAESLTTSAPPGRPIRVVEVGAGTGGTTAAILPYLPPGRVEYDFTDVSEFFLARAEERFGDFPFVRYGLLDLERDPVAQGFACHQYDLVIAANVVHATTDLARTIDRLCALLVPDGALVLYEVTDPPPYVDVTVALIEGWQKFDDGLRDGGPLLDVGRWRALLQARGLAEVVSLPAEGSPAGLLSSHVLIARGPGGTGVPVAGPAPAASAPVATAVGRPRPEAAGPEADDGGDGVLRALDRTPVSEHVEVLVDFVRRQVARVLRRDSFETIGRDHRLMDLGLDSLMAVALRDRLGRALRLDRPLPATLIFDYPCVADIAALLAARLGEPPVEQAVMTHSRDEFTPSLPVGAAGLNGLSDAEVERLLLEKLETL